MDVRTVPIDEINPAPYNPRKNLKPGDPEYEKLARSIDEFGCVEPLVWNKRTGFLVGGHQRLKVLRARDATEIEVSVVDLSPEREKALNIALNKISGDWNEQALAELLQELAEAPDIALELTGFDLDEVEDLFADVLDCDSRGNDDGFDIDDALARAGPPITALGDLIVMGRDPKRQHRLLCGDCTDSEQVRRLMMDERAALFATDPPYLVGYDGTNHPGSKKKRGGRNRGASKDWSNSYGATWDDADGNSDLYERFCQVAVDEAVRPNAAWYCWHASRRQAMVESAWIKAGAFVHCQIIWTKNRPILTRTWYLWQHEPCFMGWIKPPNGQRPPRVTKKRLSTVWPIDTIPNGEDRPDHPTPKPLEVFEIPMRQHTHPGDVCYEPFAGSGTQFIAAEHLGRRCFGLEISPIYCDLIVRRYIAIAGEDAVTPEIAEKYRLPALEEVSS